MKKNLALEIHPRAKLEALRESIDHWDRIASASPEPSDVLGMEGCSLCKLYACDGLMNRHSNKDCIGCPVMLRTGKRYCRGTPYDEITDEQSEEWLLKKEVYDRKFYEVAAFESQFLRSLIPIENK